MSFSQDVARIAADMGKTLEETAAAIFTELFISVVEDTPVDTGRLQGNWQVTIDNPAHGELLRTGKSGPIADIHATVHKPAVYWLTNNLPYGPRIEYDGWSHTKAPEGMVRKNVSRIRSIVRRRAAALR